MIVTSASAGQVNDSDFAEFFLQALETGVGRRSGEPRHRRRTAPVACWTAYNWAVLHTAEWTVRQRLSSQSGDARAGSVEGKQSAEIFQKLYSGPGVSPDRRFVPSPASEAPDGPVEIW